MHASGFMNARIAGQYSSPRRVIVVSIALMERFLARRSSLAAARAVAVDDAPATGQEVHGHHKYTLKRPSE
jgi:hypothetical protein